MISMNLVFEQILIIFGYVAVGLGAGKLGLVNPEQRKYLTRLCSDLMLPFTILSAASMKVGADGFRSLAIAMAVMFAVIGGTLILSMAVCRVLHAERKLSVGMTSLIAFPNLTFLGLPLCIALFGEIAVLYNSAALIAFNVIFFLVQAPLFTGDKISVKSVLTVPTVATFVLLGMLMLDLHWPAPVQTVMSNVGSMVTPMSLIVIGVMLSESDFLSIFREKAEYPVVIVRNFLVPLISLGILHFVPMATPVRLCVLVFLSCPCATMTSIYAIQTDTRPELCARSVLLSTLAFGISLPLIIAAGQLFL